MPTYANIQTTVNDESRLELDNSRIELLPLQTRPDDLVVPTQDSEIGGAKVAPIQPEKLGKSNMMKSLR